MNKTVFYYKADHQRMLYFRSRDKDGGHTIRSAISENSTLHANCTALYSTERELLPVEVLRTLREYAISRFFAADLHIR